MFFAASRILVHYGNAPSFGFSSWVPEIALYSVFTITFASFMFVVSMRLDLSKNPILQFLGRHIFSIYIMQMIPMIVFKIFGLDSHPYGFALISIPSAILLAIIFDKGVAIMKRKIF